MEKFSAKQFIEDLKSRGATPEEVNQIVFNFVHKLKKAGKTALALALTTAMVATATACDVLQNPNASTDSQTEVYLTDSEGNIVTDESGNPMLQSPETDANTYPEIETQKYQTKTLEQLGAGFFKEFQLSKALSGYYYSSFNSEVYASVQEYSQPDSNMYIYMNSRYKDKADDYMQYQTVAMQQISNLLASKNKNFTINFELANSIYHTYSLTVNDEKQVFVLSVKDKYMGNEQIISGIIGGDVYYSNDMPFITESNADLVSAYLQQNTFADFTTNMLAFLPAHILPYGIRAVEQDGNSVFMSMGLSAFNKDLGDVFEREKDRSTLIEINVTNGEFKGFDIVSAGIMADPQTPIPMNSDLITIELEDGITAEVVKDALVQNTEQEIPAEPETESEPQTN